VCSGRGKLVGIQWQEVLYTSSGGVLVYLPRSKTDQVGQGAWVFVTACEQEPGDVPGAGAAQVAGFVRG
jgi:hypothetical protein